ncbi:MAG: TonB family protein [Candidatus Omnitrophota bacterium]
MKKIRSTVSILVIFAFTIGLFATSDAQDNAAAPSGDPGKISLDLKGMDVVEVIKMLSAKGDLNVVVGSNVKGRVTIFLKSVGIMDAFDIILVANDLAYDRRGDIIYVMSQKDYEAMYGERYADKKEVRVFQLKYAKAVEVAKAANQLKTKIGKAVVDEGSNTLVVIDSPVSVSQISDMIAKVDMPTATRIFELKYAKAADLKAKVAESLTKGVGTMQIDERTNKIAVTDLEKKMSELETMITAFDDKLPQVLIEAKIVQITLDDKFKLGVDWESVLKKLSKEVSIKSTFELATQNTFTPGAQVLVGALNSGSDYAMMVQALKTVGDTNLLSSPRITALNNQEAKILVGTSQPYATNTVTQGTATTTTGTSLSFLDVGVKLYVTPTVNKDDFVTMKIKPEVSSTSSSYTYGSPSTTVPIVETTQAETSVTVKDGTTIIIAGLIKDQRTSQVDKVPILGDIPYIGEAFKKTVKEVVKQELVVFLTPHIISGGNDYLEQPLSPPVGEKRFTVPEKPTFDRRNEVALRPGYFEQRKEVLEDEADKAARRQRNEGSILVSTEDEYSYFVKTKIVENVRSAKRKKRSMKGTVKVAFMLSPAGDMVSGPEVVKSSNHALDRVSLNSVKNAAPFPAFPASMGPEDKRFVIDISFE